MSWATLRLKHLAAIRVSNVDKKSVDGQAPVRLCNYTDVYHREAISTGQDFMAATATPEQIDTFGLRSGDVIITKDSEAADDIGVSALVAESAPDLVCGYHLAVLRPKPGAIDGRYLHWAMSSHWVSAQLAARATGVTRFGLRTDVIANTLVKVPALSEQRRIAEFLAAETDRVDSVIAAKDRFQALLREKAQVSLERFIGASNEGPVRSIPLKHLVDPVRPIVYGIVLPGPHVPDGVLLIKGGDVEREALDPNGLSRTAPGIEAGYPRSRLRSGDLLVSIRGSFGAVAEVPIGLDGANITQDSARVTPGAGVHPRYLFHALRSGVVQRQLGSIVTGATIRGINIRDLRRVRVPVPTPRRQAELAEALDDLTEHIAAMRTALGRQVALLREHRQALITAAVTGQLDPSSYRESALTG